MLLLGDELLLVLTLDLDDEAWLPPPLLDETLPLWAKQVVPIRTRLIKNTIFFITINF